MTARTIYERFPIEPILPRESPIQRLRGLEKKIGTDVELFVKRDDDLIPGCGNKLRYIEFVLGQARRRGASEIIHCGGPTSNYLVQLAMIGARNGLTVRTAIQCEEPGSYQGNLLMLLLLGADMRFIGTASCGAVKEEWAKERASEGAGVYAIVPPFSNHSGILGFLKAADELAAQISAGELPEPSDIFMCSAGNSYLGLKLGLSLNGIRSRVHAFSPIRFDDAGLGALATDRAAFLRRKLTQFAEYADVDLPEISPSVDESQVGAGYPIPSPESTKAVSIVAKSDGVILDPIYTGKAMAGLLAHLERQDGRVPGPVLFWHSGGQTNNFSYGEELSNR